MNKLLIATSNAGKFAYMKYMLEDVGDLGILGLSDVGLSHHAPEETGDSYEDNALLKAKYFFDLTGIATIGEDSGIIVEAIKDELGLHTRRWGAGKDATDEEWLEFFMERMTGEHDRRARFVSTVVYYNGDHHPSVSQSETSPLSGENIKVFYGEIHGWITTEIEAPIQKGLPLSSVFRPVKTTGDDGHEYHERVFSAMTDEEKEKESHRGRAMRELRDWIESKRSCT
jgi:XTP/dITP diphosphohydrolase